MSAKNEKVFLNDRIVPAEEACVPVSDAGFTHAVGLFETLRAYHGRVMRLSDHVERMTRSAATLEMQIAIAGDTLDRAIREVLAANHLDEARLRVTVTPGAVPREGDSCEVPPRPTLLITAHEVRPYPSELYKHGMRVCICPYKQSRLDPLAGHKTLAYFPRLLAMKDAAERKCHEALWFNTENQLAEGSICNVFTVHDGRIVTPPLDTPILPGIVRKAVIELAQAHDMPLDEKPININDLLAATEVFLTGSVMEIMPVTAIERHRVGEGRPGDVTQRVRELYADLVTKECG
ncbi:MAG: aminotransferase class IV family protein [Phycisphaerae bacterium]|nr:aminotransferase class IV family protein [Phycisphaerae bacterium]